jgi:membrane associated rhomboid family serine protease
MIIIPMTRKGSWRNPPWITIALILINVFVFILFQSKDDECWADAMAFYFESDLATLEADFYGHYLEIEGRSPEVENLPGADAPDSEKKAYYYNHIRQSDDFLHLLGQGRIISGDDPRFMEWQILRGNYDRLLEQVVTVKYGFRPVIAAPFTWLSTMFLHGGWGHLIGNMVFLWLVGCLIEYGCRHAVYPAIYLLGGFCATGLFWVLNMQSTIPLVGASGAISCIMGALTVFYGVKKINIFINLGFYFNYLKFPAIFLLPFWMGNELYQMLFNDGSPVAYAAHLGGLGGGALLAFAVSRIPGMLDKEAFEAVAEDKVGPLVERALGYMGELKYDKARPLLAEALSLSPDNTAIWRHLHVIDGRNPASEQFHRTVAMLLTLYCRVPDTCGEALSLFREYRRVARPPKLASDLYIRMSHAFADMGETDEAERILLALLKKAPDLPSLPTALLKLAKIFRQQNQHEKYRQCVALLTRHYPQANETRLVAELL